MQSYIVTKHHVIADCLNVDWLARQVTVKHNGVEYVGFVWAWRADKDLASILTSGLIPVVPSVFNIKRPVLGDAVVAIGSTAGIPGTATQGAIASVTASVILTAAPA